VPLIRLDRLLAARGAGTRREVVAIVRRGRVTLDGRVVTDEATRVDEDAVPALDGAPLPPPPWLAVLHKPVGVHSTVGDPLGRDNLAGVAAPLLAAGLHPVGRLDHDSEGLLPFARDGALTQRLLHPRHAVEKEYVATVDGAPPADLGARLAAGVPTADGPASATLVAVDGPTVRLVVTEGRHRIVRRMLANLGLPVTRLVRVRFGALSLDDLPPGAARAATDDELAWARALLAPARRG
jgi:23S rRNA pseudouridine2605 synthase